MKNITYIWFLLLISGIISTSLQPLLANEVHEKNYTDTLHFSDADSAGVPLPPKKGTLKKTIDQENIFTDSIRNVIQTDSISSSHNEFHDKQTFPWEQTIIKMSGKRLTIENLPEDGVLEIFNIMGAKVFNRRVKAGTNQYLLSLPKGYYILKIGSLTRKIAIR